VAQRCLELMAYFHPHYWTLESRGPPGLDSRVFMRKLEPLRSTVTYCRYGTNRWKATSIWTNVTWQPEQISRMRTVTGGVCGKAKAGSAGSHASNAALSRIPSTCAPVPGPVRQ
jgi:hypothetical protein